MCDSPRTRCGIRIPPIYMRREQAIIEWARRVISIVACCHTVKLCTLAARAFRSQQTHYSEGLKVRYPRRSYYCAAFAVTPKTVNTFTWTTIEKKDVCTKSRYVATDIAIHYKRSCCCVILQLFQPNRRLTVP